MPVTSLHGPTVRTTHSFVRHPCRSPLNEICLYVFTAFIYHRKSEKVKIKVFVILHIVYVRLSTFVYRTYLFLSHSLILCFCYNQPLPALPLDAGSIQADSFHSPGCNLSLFTLPEGLFGCLLECDTESATLSKTASARCRRAVSVFSVSACTDST